MVALAAVRRRSPWVIAGVVIVVLVVLFGLRSCSGKVIDAGGVKVMVAGYQSGGSDALGGGTLEVVGDCLGADGDVYVFPQGTKVVDEDPLTVDIPDVGEVSLGEEFDVGGGWEVEHSFGRCRAGVHRHRWRDRPRRMREARHLPLRSSVTST